MWPWHRLRRREAPHRILLIVDDQCAPPAIRRAIAARADGWPSEVLVVEPVGGRRLDAIVDELATIRGVDARRGRIGSRDPIQAADEGLRHFAADEIVFAVACDAGGRRPRARAVDIAPSRYEIPVTIARLASTRS